MENLGRVLISLMIDSASYTEDTNFNLEDSRFENMQEQPRLNLEDRTRILEQPRLNLEERTRILDRERKIKSRSVTLGLNTIVAALSEDTNWKVVQAKRKREKEDLFHKHPGFDPIFMKV